MLPPLYTMNNNPVGVRKAGTVSHQSMAGIQSSAPILPNYGRGHIPKFSANGEAIKMIDEGITAPQPLNFQQPTIQIPQPTQQSFLSKYRNVARTIAMGVEYSRSKKIPNTLVAGLVPYIYFVYVAYDEYKKRK